jgi:hypothetical protein
LSNPWNLKWSELYATRECRRCGGCVSLIPNISEHDEWNHLSHFMFLTTKEEESAYTSLRLEDKALLIFTSNAKIVFGGNVSNMLVERKLAQVDRE